MKVRLFSLVFMIIFMSSLISGVYSIQGETVGMGSMKLIIGNQHFTVGNDIKEIDPGRDTVPVIISSRTLLPIRAIIEAMGGKIEWNEVEKKVTINTNNNTIELWMTNPQYKEELVFMGVGKPYEVLGFHEGRKKMNVNGEEKTNDVAPIILNDRTYMPLRFVVENVGAEVLWNGEEKSVTILYSIAVEETPVPTTPALPTTEPTVEPTKEPTTEPTVQPTTKPTVVPPTQEPTAEPTPSPSPTLAPGEDIAFPGAQGWAAKTPGGRGGQIIRVTNHNASGPGSFTEAVNTPGPRIVVFEVGGVIDMEGLELRITEPFLTIAGQTAPSPGITLIDCGIVLFDTHDIIIQHIRVRPGAARHEKGWGPDGISTNKAYNVIIDHCSVTWAVDENMSASGPRFEGETPEEWRANTSHTITFSNNIIAECLRNATHKKGDHSKGSLMHDNVTEAAVIGNLYASHDERNPLFKGGTSGIVVNNYIYNPGETAIRYRLASGEWEGYEHQKGYMTIIGNVLKYGPDTPDIPIIIIDDYPCEVYHEDNVAKDQNGDDVSIYRAKGDTPEIVDSPPVWHDNVQTIPSSELWDSIVQNVGARPWDRDEIDTRIINDTLNGTGRIIDWETDVEGYPTHEPTQAPFNPEEWDLRYMIRIDTPTL